MTGGFPSQKDNHYNDAIMSAMPSEITGVSIVCSSVGSGADQRKHQSSASLAFLWGIHRWPVNSPHKGPVTRKMFPFDDVTMNAERVYILCWEAKNRCILSEEDEQVIGLRVSTIVNAPVLRVVYRGHLGQLNYLDYDTHVKWRAIMAYWAAWGDGSTLAVCQPPANYIEPVEDSSICAHIEAETKWEPCCRRHSTEVYS